MGIRNLSTASISTGTKRSKVWDQSTALTSYESIATVTVGAGGQSSISFTSIPSTYKHLQIRAIQFCGTTSYNTLIRYNSDSGSNYASHYLEGTGTSVGTGNAYNNPPTNAGAIGEVRGGTTYPDIFICDILDYANTNKNKTARSISGFNTNSAGLVAMRSSLWMSTSAITSITITNDASAAFAEYSRFALYGIKGA